MTDKIDHQTEADADTHHVDDVAVEQRQHNGPNVTGLDEEEINRDYWLSPRFIGSCLAIVFVGNSLFFGYAIPVNILNVINEDLGPSTDISLVTLINTLCQGVANLLVGSLSDAIGRRWFLVGGQILGVVGSCLGGASTSVSMLIGASVFTGIGAACQLTYPLLVMEIVPNKYRGWAQGIITLLVLPSLGFGPIVGRAIIESSGWRWTYWVSAIINGIGLLLLLVFYHPPNFAELQSRKSAMKQLMETDFLGFALYAGSIICLLLALTWGGVTDPWNSGKIIALLVVGCVVLIGFFVYETYMPLKQPLLPVSLFKIKNYSIAVAVGSIGQMSYYALNVLWPMQATSLYTTDIITVGWLSCTTGVALAAGEIIMGPLFKPIGHIKWQLIIASAGLCLFGGLMAATNADRQGLAIGCTIMAGFFIGWVELVAIVMAGLVVPPETIGVAQTFFSATRAVTGTVATSIYLAIYNGRLGTNLPNRVLSYATDAGLPASSSNALLSQLDNTTSTFEQVPGVNNAIITAIGDGQKSAYAASLSTVYLSSLAFGGSALILSWFVTDINKYLTSFVNKTVAGRSMRANQVDEKTETGDV